jgi:ATP-dependent DNA helicase RecG
VRLLIIDLTKAMTESNNLLDLVLEKVSASIDRGVYQEVEHPLVELKDLSTGNVWSSLKETICAYLNTKGGYVICGIRERDKSYKATGFDRNNEGRLIELRTKFFKNDNQVLVDLSNHIDFDYKDFRGQTIAILTIHPLSEDQKFLSIDGKYYERVLTQDKEVRKERLSQHRDYKLELEYAKEINLVPNATKADLDVNKINQFIIRINATGRKETIKRDIDDATDFLIRRNCTNNEGQVSVLGMLLFGTEPFRFLEYRAEVDCYFETGTEIGRDKKYIQDDVFNLMDDTFSFVWNHIKVGRSYVGGGRSMPEFPEKLIREVINNALAHRDYTSNKFITVKINPGENVEIKNPGAFKSKMLITHKNKENPIYRIIPGMPETRNPKLADVLKAFDKIESQGIGMATLVSACLENEIDVPFYDLSNEETISLVIPSGKLIDDASRRWLDSFGAFIQDKIKRKPTIEHELVLVYLLKSERLNGRGKYTLLLSPSNNHFEVLDDLQHAGLIIEHPDANLINKQVFILDPALKQTDFTSQIASLTQKSVLGLDQDALILLNIIYRFHFYNNQSVKPSILTPELYFTLHGKHILPTKYESLGRKVRKLCKELEQNGFLSRESNGAYLIRERGGDSFNLFDAN